MYFDAGSHWSNQCEYQTGYRKIILRIQLVLHTVCKFFYSVSPNFMLGDFYPILLTYKNWKQYEVFHDGLTGSDL
jgi:hypothetical protein